MLLLTYSLQTVVEAGKDDFMSNFFVSMLVDAAVNQPFIGFLQDVLVLRVLVYYYLPNAPEMTSYPRLLNAAFAHARAAGASLFVT